MAIESAKCACCDLREDCTEEYIRAVRASFRGEWLCGLCAEAVGDELGVRGRSSSAGATTTAAARARPAGLEEAMRAHMAFCGKSAWSNPATRVADGMRQMLRRRSAGDLTKSPAAAAAPAAEGKVFGRSASSSQVIAS